MTLPLQTQLGRYQIRSVIATFYAKANRTDEVIKWLEKGYEERDFRMTKRSVAFEFDGLRSDPRFKELVRRMGLPE
jgi:hypothetical protein